MARKKTPADSFRERLDGLSNVITHDLRLPSLEAYRLEGYAYLFRLVLPLLDAKGKHAFTDPILDELFQVLDTRFGGCMVASSSSAPPLWGLWHPPQESHAEKDYLTTVEVLANPIEAANRFFAGLKPILKTAGHIEQQEILNSATRPVPSLGCVASSHVATSTQVSTGWHYSILYQLSRTCFASWFCRSMPFGTIRISRIECRLM